MPTPPNDDISANDHAVIDSAVAALMKHFDTVQVFVTREEGQGTIRYGRGKGNWYARYGQVHGWLLHADESELEDYAEMNGARENQTNNEDAADDEQEDEET